MCAAVLSLEGIALGLTAPVLVTIAGVPVVTSMVVAVGLAVGCLVLAGLLRKEWAYLLGWVVQVAAVGLGAWVPLMFVLGGIFAALWATAYFLGRKLERDRTIYSELG